MKGKNQTSVNEFILLGFSDLPKLKSLLFVVFLVMYILTLLGNFSIITIIRIDPHLHTPMYYFLTNLSFVDICYSSTITPKALIDFKEEENTISLFECAMQLFMFLNLGSAECFLLAVMAYDRYVAICNPLHYTVVMTRRVCTQLVTGVYTVSTVYSLLHTVNIFSVNFCESNEINHFYCDAHPLLKLSCSDTSSNEIVLSILAGVFGFLAVIPIVLSYILIISAILRIRSSEGRRKAFSTCASHFFTVNLFFGTLIFIYVIPSSYFSLYTNRALSVIYTMVIPMVNPMIYSLRNKDVKQALRKMKTAHIQLSALGTMKGKNQTSVTEFILLGFSDLPKLQSLLFVVFLIMYILTLLGNISITTIVRVDPQLHKPMYYFLTNLSFVDICYSSTITPKALVDFKVEENTISLLECATQLFMFINMAAAECLLLAVMAYDRYVAICNPLHYPVVMTRRVCGQMMIGVYIISTVCSCMHTVNIFSVNFCGSNKINHFYCDAHPLLKLSCSDTFFNEMVLSILAGIVGFLSVITVVLSYILIISAILRIRSSEGRHKAFSTCASHFFTVILFFGTLIFIYVIPSSQFSLYINRVLSVIYTMVIPMVNPMIYSLRNKDVKQALRKILEKKWF
ncbi:olfactory receptor 2M2-like [Microcaecilia unicolor]|uniref:Olfactory receptor 2M2-like n=1 Tax=Microcaecilia unicolor TaxID=1415580 RepID=A0A6P7WU00_9AMPH|nr:olfactory receptor 2M2-like [Microcaecilia unicolor]